MRLMVLAMLMGLAAGPARADPDALWKIVHDKCVPNQTAHGDPAPCAGVELGGGEARGVAFLKDLRGVAQFLAIPTAKIQGIESPALLQPGAPNYWMAAWDARRLMATRLGRPIPDEDVGLAVNSEYGRSQNQLHIHIDCLKPEVKQALAAAAPKIGYDWSNFTLPLAGQNYAVRRMAAKDLSTTDPFRLLAETRPEAKADMASQTLALAGAIFPGGEKGFYLLNDHARLVALDHASSENILDHDCALVK